MKNKRYILTREVAEKKLRRMALEIVERNYEVDELVLIGIRENGIVIAKKIQAFLEGIYSGTVTVASVSLNKTKPHVVTLQPATELTNKVVLLIDDVANSGRTMLYALKPLLETVPKKIQTLALVERTHKSFPIALDYVGISIATTPDEHIYVEVDDTQEVSGAWMNELT